MATSLEIVSKHESAEDAEYIVSCFELGEHAVLGQAGLWVWEMTPENKISLTLIEC